MEEFNQGVTSSELNKIKFIFNYTKMTNLYFKKFEFQTQIIISTMNTIDYIM